MPRSDASSHGEGHECQIKGRLACHHLCARVPLLRLRASNLECPTGPRRGCIQEPEAVLQVDLTFLTVQLFNHMVCVFYGLSYPQHVFELGTLARPRFPSRAVSETTTSPPSMLTLRSTHRPSHCLGCCPSHFTCYPASFKLLDSLYHLHTQTLHSVQLTPRTPHSDISSTPPSPSFSLGTLSRHAICYSPAPYTSHSTLQCATSFFIQHSQLRTPHATPQTLPNYSAQTPHPTT